MIVHSLKEFSDKCSTIMDVVPKDATEKDPAFKNACDLMADITLQLGDTGYNLIDHGIAKKMLEKRNGK